MSRYGVGYVVARLALALAVAVLLLGIGSSVFAWMVYGAKIDAARVEADPSTPESVEAMNAAYRGAIEELRTAGFPVTRQDLVNPEGFQRIDSVDRMDAQLAVLAAAGADVEMVQNQVAGPVTEGFDEIISQLVEISNRSAVPGKAEPQAATAAADDAGSAAPAGLFSEGPEVPTYKQRADALDSAKVALLSLLTEVERPENRVKVERLLANVTDMQKFLASALDAKIEKPAPSADDDDAADPEPTLRKGASRSQLIANVLEKRKSGVMAAVLGHWAVADRMAALRSKLEERRVELVASEKQIANLTFQRNWIIIGLLIVSALIAIVMGAAGDVVKAILDCAKHLGSI